MSIAVLIITFAGGALLGQHARIESGITAVLVLLFITSAILLCALIIQRVGETSGRGEKRRTDAASEAVRGAADVAVTEATDAVDTEHHRQIQFFLRRIYHEFTRP